MSSGTPYPNGWRPASRVVDIAETLNARKRVVIFENGTLVLERAGRKPRVWLGVPPLTSAPIALLDGVCEALRIAVKEPRR